MQSFADVPVTSDGVETASFLDASDGLVNMFGKYPNALTGPASKPIPPKRPPWRRRVFLCPGRFANQHWGVSPSCLLGRPSTVVLVNIYQCNRNRGSGPAMGPITRYPPRLRCWSPARPRKVRDKVPPVWSASCGTYAYVLLFAASRLPSFCSAPVHSGLLFTCRALENMQADHTSELRACFKRSYDDVLKHHHGWLIQTAVTVRLGNTRPFS